jgi:hypothetical protein
MHILVCVDIEQKGSNIGPVEFRTLADFRAAYRNPSDDTLILYLEF